MVPALFSLAEQAQRAKVVPKPRIMCVPPELLPREAVPWGSFPFSNVGTVSAFFQEDLGTSWNIHIKNQAGILLVQSYLFQADVEALAKLFSESFQEQAPGNTFGDNDLGTRTIKGIKIILLSTLPLCTSVECDFEMLQFHTHTGSVTVPCDLDQEHFS